ncbi:MAG: CHAT domain-containing tetratricopeptide repeat protein [Acidobacteriota bacterium]
MNRLVDSLWKRCSSEQRRDSSLRSSAKLGWRGGALVALITVLSFPTAASAEAVAAETAAEKPSGRLLALGDVLSGSLEGEESHRFEIAEGCGLWTRVAVEQIGIDLVIQLETPEGEVLATGNAPFGRQGMERVVLSPDSSCPRIAVITPASTSDGAGEYEISFSVLESETPEGQQRLAAERAMAAGGVAYHQGGAEGFQQASRSFAEAGELWRQLGDDREGGLATYAEAYTVFDLGELKRSMTLYQDSLQRWRAAGDRRFEAVVLSDLGLGYYQQGDLVAATEHYQQAAEIQRSLGNSFGEAVAQNNLCLLTLRLPDPRPALPCFEALIGIYKRAEETYLGAIAQINFGGAFASLGEPRKALEQYFAALETFQDLGDLAHVARLRNNIGRVQLELTELHAALESFDQAHSFFKSSGERPWVARTLSNQGDVYVVLGDWQRAATFFERALELRRAVDDKSGEAITLRRLGDVQLFYGQADEALARYRQAIHAAESAEDLRQQTILRDRLGQAFTKMERYPEALETFDQAVHEHHASGNPVGEATTRIGRSAALEGLGSIKAAEQDLKQALELATSARWPAGEAQIRYRLAQIAVSTGKTAEAMEQLDEVIRIFESLRVEVEIPTLRASFSSTVQDAYELKIDLLMRAGDKVGAFEVSERARGRALLDLLGSAGAVSASNIEPQLLDRRSRALEELAAKTRYRLELVSSGSSAERTRVATQEVDAALASLELVDAEIQRLHPQAEASQGTPLSAEGVRQALDSETLLLSISLGTERSYLWAVDHRGLEAFTLPGRAHLESLAQEMLHRIRDSGPAYQPHSDDAARELSEFLLKPIWARLGARRLAIAADGALFSVPFAALPVPALETAEASQPWRPLISETEVALVPSMSSLVAQRQLQAPDQLSKRQLAVFADPVLSELDPRLSERDEAPVSESASLASLDLLRGLDYQRLPGTRREADAISALLPAEQKLVALGFEANRERLLQEGLEQYRMLHLATHGVFDAERPLLSGIALSLYDPEGQPQQGVLRLHDLLAVEAAPELVVLSGCETALGQNMRGEGVLGLTYGFLQAGVGQVVASQWKVQDGATAHFMTLFYRSLLDDGVEPGAALRKVQLALYQDRRWRSPYFWGAFSMWGDWLS